jgi:predicted XRE-type DNA-binding protein
MNDEIPFGYCHCGCGQKTNISKHTSIKHNRVKGEPTQYLTGHGKRELKPPKPPRVKPNPIDVFWNLVDRRGPDECWEWIGVKQFGYGIFSINGINAKAHRYSWELAHGPIPKGIFACHKCDNRSCVNPNHLFMGTPADNLQDMAQKQRSLLGERNHKARLTAAQVQEIRNLYAAGNLSQTKIAEQYGVNQTQVSRIILRRQWHHIDHDSE